MISYYPLIRCADYATIRMVMPKDHRNFPENYDEWLSLLREKIAYEQARGIEVQRVTVLPREFATYCAIREANDPEFGAPTLLTLMHFARDKAANFSPRLLSSGCVRGSLSEK
jgi:hypothetical protein